VSLPGRAPVSTLPTLDELARHPELAENLSTDARRALTLGALTVIAACAALSPVACEAPVLPEPDHLLSPEEAATALGVKVSWIYRHAPTLPFARRLSRKCLRFSAAGLRRWQAARRA
jgi:predicted DNA-binding transcriptional regulator AlpA